MPLRRNSSASVFVRKRLRIRTDPPVVSPTDDDDHHHHAATAADADAAHSHSQRPARRISLRHVSVARPKKQHQALPATPVLPVAVIGGGLSGVYAAFCLHDMGVDFQLFEAEEGVGGVLRSTRITQDGTKVEGGPSWVWREQVHAVHMLHVCRIKLQRQYDSGKLFHQRRYRDVPESFRDGHFVGKKLYTVRGGMQQFPERLSSPIRDNICTGHRLKQMTKVEEGWHLLFNNRGQQLTMMARYVVLAVPPTAASHLLRNVALSSKFWHSLESVIQESEQGAYKSKFIAVYSRPFWRNCGFSGSAACDTGPLNVVFDGGLMLNEKFALMGYGTQHLGHDIAWTVFERRAVRQLEALFGPVARKPLKIYVHDWASRPWKPSFDESDKLSRRGQRTKECFKAQKALSLSLACSEMGLGSHARNIEGAMYAGSCAAEAAVNFVGRDGRR